MTLRQSLIAQLALAIVIGLVSAYFASSMPSIVPTHWGINGKPDAYGTPAFALWFGPALAAFMMLMTWATPKLSPKRFEIDRFEKTFGIMMLIVALMMGSLHVLILLVTAGRHIDMVRGMMVIIGIFFSIMGNYLGKIRMNFYMGVRTPWTLSSERVWEATHRRAGLLWFFGGLLIAVASLLGAPFAIGMMLLLAISLWPILDSYLLYRKLEG